jgi:hypothetical protein
MASQLANAAGTSDGYLSKRFALWHQPLAYLQSINYPASISRPGSNTWAAGSKPVLARFWRDRFYLSTR